MLSHFSRVWLLYRNGTDELTCKAEIETTGVENKLTDTKVERGGGMNREIGIDTYTLLCIKERTDENLLYSTGNSTQFSVVT